MYPWAGLLEPEMPILIPKGPYSHSLGLKGLGVCGEGEFILVVQVGISV